jgi:replicative DNA helicase
MGADIGARVTGAAFSSTAHQTVFKAVKDLKTAGADVNLLTLAHELEKRGQLDAAGGEAAVAELTSLPTAGNAAFYEAEVLKAYRVRGAWRAAVTAKEALESGAPDADAVMAKLAADLAALEAGAGGGGEADEGGILFNDLLKKQFPPEDWFVDELITTGLTIISGSPKVGKSFMALQLAQALDFGGCFLEKFKTRKCDVLYCALEDTPKRIQKRLQKQGFTVFNGSRLETKRRTVGSLRAFLKANPNFRVVIVDTMQKMLQVEKGNGYSDSVMATAPLKSIADDLDVAIIAITHNRKGCEIDMDHVESIIGSIGFAATADTAITMRRKRGESQANIKVTGRDVEDAAYTLSWNADICSWSVAERVAMKPALPEAQQAIIDLLESEARDFTTAEVVEATGKSAPATSNILKRLQEAGHIESPGRGLWRAKSKFTYSHPLRESEYVNFETAPSAPAPAAAAKEDALW